MKVAVEQILVDILRQELELDANNVWIQDENRTIPTDEGLYIVVGLGVGKPISSVNSFDSETGNEIQELIASENIQIDIFSRSTDLIKRRWEIALALHSVLSRQQQEKNNFKIFKNPTSFINASGAEGGSNIIRYTATVVCHVWYRKEKVLQSLDGDYYDDFNQRVDDSVSIETPHGIIEFEIE